MKLVSKQDTHRHRKRKGTLHSNSYFMSLSGHWDGIHIALTVVLQMLRTFYWTHPGNPLFEAAPSVRSYGSPGRDGTLCPDTEALDQALLLAVTLRHQRHHPFTVYTRPRDATSPASALSTWAQASATPRICLHHSASRWAWTLVPGLFLVTSTVLQVSA